MAFWGIKLKPGKPFRQTLEEFRLHISQATLGPEPHGKRISVKCKVGDGRDIFLCSLIPGVTESCSLNLLFEEEAVFSVVGSSSVHLAGYFEPFEEPEGSETDGDSLHDSEDEDMVGQIHNSGVQIEEIVDEPTQATTTGKTALRKPIKSPKKGEEEKRRKKLRKGQGGAQIEEIVDEPTQANSTRTATLRKAIKSLEKGEEEKRRKKSRKGQGTGQEGDTNNAEIVVKNDQLLEDGSKDLEKNDAVESDEDGFILKTTRKSDAKAKTAAKNGPQVEDRSKGPKNDDRDESDEDGFVLKTKRKSRGNAEIVTKKEGGSKALENNGNDQSHQNGVTLKAKRKSKSNDENGLLKKKRTVDSKLQENDCEEEHAHLEPTYPSPILEDAKEAEKKKMMEKKETENKSEVVESQEQEIKTVVIHENSAVAPEKIQLIEHQSSGRKGVYSARIFPNGLEVQEIAMGEPDGKQARPGKRVGVIYTGALKSTGEIFDSNVGGKPFEFRLGIGEVIKGWDVGVNGMRVGDKRKLTVPPTMGYGSNEDKDHIPADSWLVFNVELVHVK